MSEFIKYGEMTPIQAFELAKIIHAEGCLSCEQFEDCGALVTRDRGERAKIDFWLELIQGWGRGI